MGLFGDSFATGAAKRAVSQDTGMGTSLFNEGQGIQAGLLPFLRGELNATHGFDPTQLNEMLTSAAAGSGGAAGSLSGDAALTAARTNNTAGYSGVLDKIARAKTQGLAKANESIASADVMEAEKKRQAGAAGMESLYGADTGDALKAMGLSNEAVKTEADASGGGWFRNLLGSLGSLSSTALNAAKIAG